MSVAKARLQDKRDKGKTFVSSTAPRNAVTWVNPAPSEADTKWLAANSEKYMDLLKSLGEGLQPLDSITLKEDPQSLRWIAVLFLHSRAEKGIAPAISVRGRSAFHAHVLLAYMHVHKHMGSYTLSMDDPDTEWG